MRRLRAVRGAALDTRNMKELTHGTFERALTLPIGKFTEFPTALEQHREALRGLNLLIQS